MYTTLLFICDKLFLTSFFFSFLKVEQLVCTGEKKDYNSVSHYTTYDSAQIIAFTLFIKMFHCHQQTGNWWCMALFQDCHSFEKYPITKKAYKDSINNGLNKAFSKLPLSKQKNGATISRFKMQTSHPDHKFLRTQRKMGSRTLRTQSQMMICTDKDVSC